MAQQVCAELMFPFINQMILENGIVDTPEEVGFYSGFIESTYQITCFCAVLPCAALSNRFGRKPVMLCGMVGMAAFTALFGVSKSYAAMLAMRGAAGAMSGGAVTVSKVIVSEMSSGTGQIARAFSLYQVSYRLGQMVGQPLGGLLAHPNRTILFLDMPFFRAYPFALPGFASAVIMAICAGFVAVTVPETLPRNTGSQHQDHRQRGKWKWTVLHRNTIAILASLFSMAVLGMMIFILYPLFAFTPTESGGLGLTEPQIGVQMGFRSFMSLVFMLIYTYYAPGLSAMKTYKACMCLKPFVYAFLPALNALARVAAKSDGAATWAFDGLLLAYFTAWSTATLVSLSTNLIINDSSPSPEMLPTVMGISQMILSIGYAVVPTCITTLFAYSVDHHVLGGNLVYVVMVFLALLGALQALTLKDPAAAKRNEQEAD